MLYLDEVTIHNFKSFKHSFIKFNRGFNCVVGPNGSGKSNICDSILFALGEMSLKRMRALSSMQLINSGAKADESGFKRAYVKVKFSGDKDIEITRSIKSNKKMGFRLDGKRATRQEVLDTLKEYKCEINETNTMTQGEITYLLNLTPKERRELIDIAAGIREFNDKRDASLKELEKVDGKINEAKVVVSERLGFLRELEKEKDDALKYMEASSLVKRLGYSLLLAREKEVTSKYGEATGQLDAVSARKREYEEKRSAIDSQIASISSERETLSKSLNAKSAEAGSTNKLVEEINKKAAINAALSGSLNDNVKSLKARVEALGAEAAKTAERLSAGNAELEKVRFELKVKEKELQKGQEVEAAATSYADISEKMKANVKEVEDLEARRLSLSSEHAELAAEAKSIEDMMSESHKQLNELGAKRTTVTASIKSVKEATADVEAALKDAEKELAVVRQRASELQAEMDAIYKESVNLREALAVAGRSSDKSMEALKARLKKGFYGRAQELCEYDEKHAVAIQSSSGSRLGYFIVDSAEIAEKAIGILKEERLGRASFIPLEDIRVSQQQGPKGLQPLISLVKFDKKFANAFSFIFSDTYLVPSIGAAKATGIGTCRYVTLEGELVERSGIITGGSTRLLQSPALIEGKLRALEAKNKDFTSKTADTRQKEEEVRRRMSEHNGRLLSLSNDMKHALSAENEINRAMEQLDARVQEQEAKKRKMLESSERSKRVTAEVVARLDAAREEGRSLRAAMDGAMASEKGSAKSKEELAKFRALRDDVERLKVSAAAMSKEIDMLKARADESRTEAAKEEAGIKTALEKIQQLAKENDGLAKQKAELQEELERHGKKTSDLFKGIQSLDDQISKLGAEKGALTERAERLSRDLMELEGQKAQLQTRLGDIKAELASQPKAETIEAPLQDLEKQLIIARSELDKYGSVNMKAPEMYEAKRADLDEANKKLYTLESEKGAIMSMIDEIETKKLAVFNETFETVNGNFKNLFKYTFGGESSLYLQAPKDPFNSGLLIEAHLAGKKVNSDMLSGGQKSVILLMLIFAIQMRRPMSMYIFDEIDVALDKENSKKLSSLIKELSGKSQFIVVSHNDSLISAADTAVGVVNRGGESQVVGVQLAKRQ